MVDMEEKTHLDCPRLKIFQTIADRLDRLPPSVSKPFEQGLELH